MDKYRNFRVMLTSMLIAVFVAALTITLSPVCSYGQGSVVVRVEDPSGSHCIDATSEEVTIHVRRIFIEKTSGLFTKDSRAGVLVTAKLTGRSTGSNVDVQVPSVTLVSIKDEKTGRVSLPLEYQIASYLALDQEDVLTTDIGLSISLAKTRGRNTFGDIIDLAGNALNKLPIPNNPFVNTTNKFLAFANDAINETTSKQLDVPFAQLSLSFNKGREPDINKCKSAGKESTGAIAVLLSSGLPDTELIPVTNTEQLYCFKYSSTSTYELLAAKKTGGRCPTDDSAYQAVNNDYVMFLISAHTSGKGFITQPSKGFITQTVQQQQIEESRKRCTAFGIEASACGVPK
jgi:hypothetical protein